MASLPNPNPKRRRLSSTSEATSASLDRLLQSALAMADPSAIGLSLERLLESTALHSDKESLVDGARKIVFSLMEAVTRSTQKLAIAHNSSAWPLPADLTIKVFSLLDTESLCFAAATCLHFGKCASDPLCYVNIDLTRSPDKVTYPVVSTMIQRAGNNLQSIKLGSLSKDENKVIKSPVTASCLYPLQLDGGASGLLLRKLHLYNLKMRRYNPCSALSACKSLSELEIVGIKFWLTRIWGTICEHCHLIERLCLDVAVARILRTFQVKDLLKGCPLLSSLTLRGFEIRDKLLSVLFKAGVSLFLSAVCYGHCKSLRCMDISSKMGLLIFESSGPHTRCAIEVSQVLRERPGIYLIADYPQKICLYGDCCTDLFSSSSNNDSGSASWDSDLGLSDIDSGSPSSNRDSGSDSCDRYLGLSDIDSGSPSSNRDWGYLGLSDSDSGSPSSWSS